MATYNEGTRLKSDLGHNGFAVSLNYFTALPDLNDLTNPELKVCFKSLMKKHSTTKEKSLTDLVQAFEEETFSTDLKSETTIQYWLQLYPKLAFDSSRNVRLLSHKVIANFLNHLGGKVFAKYLKTCLPIWLLSTYDTDKLVGSQAYNLLLDCFQKDEARVNTKIWQLFIKEIFHFIIVSLTLETQLTLSDDRNTTKEDSIAKYERVVNGSLQLLNKVLSLINDGTELGFDDYDYEQLEELLDNDNVWEYMPVVFNTKTFNSGMATTYLLLLKSIFQENRLAKDTQNILCQKISSARSLYKHASKRFIKDVKLKSLSAMYNVVFSSIILQFWGTLGVMARFSLLEGKKKPKEGMWDIVGSKGISKLISYISLGSCNLNPIYYILLEKFLLAFISNTSASELSKVEESIFDILCTQLSTETSYDYKQTAIECIIGYLDALPDGKTKFLKKAVINSIDALTHTRNVRNNSSKEGCIKLITKSLENLEQDDATEVFKLQNDKVFESVKTGNPKNSNIEGYLNVLITRGDAVNLSNILTGVMEFIGESDDEPAIIRGLEVLIDVLEKDAIMSEDATDDVVEFTNTIGAILEENTINVIERFLKTAVHRFKDRLDIFEIVDDILTKLTMLEKDPSRFILKLLDDFNFTYDDCRKSEYLSQYLDNLISKKKTEQEWKILLRFLNREAVFTRLLQHLDDDSEFVKYFDLEKPAFDLSEELVPSVKKLLTKSFELNNQSFITFVSNSNFSNLVSESLWESAKSGSVGLDSINIETIFDKLDTELSQLPNIEKLTLAVSNAIEQNIYLVENGETSKESCSLLGICNIFNSISNSDTKTIYYTGILSQYLQDYIFTLNQESISADTLVILQKALHTKFHDNLKVSLSDVLKALVTGESTDELLDLLLQRLDTKGAISSYVARLLKEILENLSEVASVNSLEEFEFNPLLKFPLRLGIVLSGLKSWISSPKFDRIKNFVVAEILGVKEDKILTDGLKWLVLSINFLSASVEIPPHRLNMVALQFEKWLDSDIAYDEQFTVIRSQLIKFVSYVEFDKEELASRLLEDNLSIIQVENNYELKYFTFKYLSRDPNAETLLELFFNEEMTESDRQINNMAVYMCQDILLRCFDKVQIKSLDEDQTAKLYDMLIDNQFVEVQSIALRLLEDHVKRTQDDLVLNYQLKTDGFNENELNLPSKLVDFVNSADVDNSSVQSSYMISWHIIFCHFKDINYSIRNQYINQIRREGALQKFLEHIFLQEEVDKIKVVDSIEEFDTRDKNQMMLHLFYSSCKYLGSEVQSWFNELRNIQLKQDIEKFTTKNISSILIDQMIKEVENGMAKIMTDVMTIKINKVTYEIRSVFEIDEQKMEMVIKIPANFPLQNVSVEGPQRIGLKENEWRAWLLSSQRVISLTNGSIIEAIEVFKKNVDLHFSGFEECAICYSILHQDHSLPSKTCSTCNNKFHAACLYKWFKTSGSSTCPLCRSTFNFRK